MKRTTLILWMIILLWQVNALAQEEKNMWILGGIQYGGLMGEGVFDNHFDKGTGWLLDFAVTKHPWAVILGTGVYSTQNWIKDKSADVSFYYPIYLEVRYFTQPKSFRPFVSMGFGFSRMHFDGTNGADNQGFLSIGGGSHFLPSPKIIIELKAKVYALFENNLANPKGDDFWDYFYSFPDEPVVVDESKPSYGFELKIGIGYAFDFKKK